MIIEKYIGYIINETTGRGGALGRDLRKTASIEVLESNPNGSSFLLVKRFRFKLGANFHRLLAIKKAKEFIDQLGPDTTVEPPKFDTLAHM